MAPYLSIVTPIYNSAKTLKIYLDSVFNSQFRDFELIIVDGLSNDSSPRIINGYNVIYEQLGYQCDSACKRNRGVEIANAPVVLFLDSDIVIPPTVLGAIADIFKNHPEIAAMIGSYDDAPGAENITSQFKFLLHHYTHQQEQQYVDSFWTGCGAIKKSVFNSLGGFNAPFLDGGSVHDIELGFRLKKNNYKVYNAKHIQVKHLKELHFGEWMYTDIFVRGIPWIIIMLTYHDFNFKLNMNISGVISSLSVLAMVFLTGASIFNGIFIYGAMIFLILFLMANWRISKFFAVKKNFFFSVIALFYLFIYYINCGICVLAAPFFYFQEYEKNRLYRANLLDRLGLK